MSRSKGFSLVELAGALAIIALLNAGALIRFPPKMDVRNVADTRRSMESSGMPSSDLARPTGGFLCPANGTIRSGKLPAARVP